MAIWLVNFDSSTDIINAVLAMLFLVVISILPIFFGYLLIRNRDNLTAE